MSLLNALAACGSGDGSGSGGASSTGGTGTGAGDGGGVGGTAAAGGTPSGGAGGVPSGGAPSGGFGGLDLDGAVLEGSLDALSCLPPTTQSACDTAPQCGCEPGQKCDVTDLDTGKATCVDDGTVQPYHSCNPFLARCKVGSACLGGACKPYCESDADCAGANSKCKQVELYKNGTSTLVPGMFTCTAGCDPVSPGLVCGSGLTCSFAGTGTTDCYSSGTGVGAGACNQNSGLACAPGYTCINTTQQTGGYSCLKWCRLTANDCSNGFVCKDLTSKPVLGGVEYGACFPL